MVHTAGLQGTGPPTLSVTCLPRSPHPRARLPLAAGRGHLDPDPAAGNATADPSGSPSPPERGCAWSPQAEGGEEPLQLPTFSPAAQARVAVTFVLFALSAGCNLAVLRAAGGRRGGRRSHIRLLLLHLAAADLLVTVAVMPLDAIWNITLQWRAGDLACRLLMYLRLLAMYASAFVTVVISLDRQAAILRPLAITRARRRNRIMLYVAWLLSAGLSVPQVPVPRASLQPRAPRQTPARPLRQVPGTRLLRLGSLPRLALPRALRDGDGEGLAERQPSRAAQKGLWQRAPSPWLCPPPRRVPRTPGERSWRRGDCGSRSRGQRLTLRLRWSLARDPGALPWGGAGSPIAPRSWGGGRRPTSALSPAVPLPHGHPPPPAQLHPVHHAGQLPPALARDALQHAGLRLPLPAAAAHHGLLLRTHPAGDLPAHGLQPL